MTTALLVAALACAETGTLTPVCLGLNTSRFKPMGCAPPNKCCKLNQQSYTCGETAARCNVCPECCHDAFAAPNACSSCVHKSCGYMDLDQYGCQTPGGRACCSPSPLPASATEKNCLLIGDSVTNGMAGDVVGYLKGVCQVQTIIGCDVANDNREGPCFEVSSSSPFVQKIPWDVIHYNEGLHSLCPRGNTSAWLSVWADQLS
eukprot:SAG11_NODE_10476_length_829_cov_0.876712_1_plen_203_part_10